jgi:hypothetical protein
MLTQQLDDLRERGAGTRFPGRMVGAERTVVRIQRGLAGGLVQDAEIDLARLRGQIDDLSERLRQSGASPGGRA